MGSQRKDLSCFLPLLPVAVVLLSLCPGLAGAAKTLQKPLNLEMHYYKNHNTCRNVEAFVQHQVYISWENDKSIVPKLLRLAFTDCFVTGCDASIMLEGEKSEKTAKQNRGLGGLALIQKIKTVLEDRCPGVVSCADIIQLATRDAVHLAGGPSYPVYTGRRDGMTSSASSVDIPSPSISLEALTAYFKSKGLDVLDLATLLGAHSTGRTHCRYIEDRLYNFNGTGKPDPTMDSSLREEMKTKCPERVKKNQSDPLVYLDPESGDHYNFTESYYRRVLKHKAVLGIDQQLLYGNDTKEITEEFANGFENFRKSFALSMNRMGNINVLTKTQGEIRRLCFFTNKNNPHLN